MTPVDFSKVRDDIESKPQGPFQSMSSKRTYQAPKPPCTQTSLPSSTKLLSAWHVRVTKSPMQGRNRTMFSGTSMEVAHHILYCQTRIVDCSVVQREGCRVAFENCRQDQFQAPARDATAAIFRPDRSKPVCHIALIL